MKKILKIFMLFSLFFASFTVSAQIDDYFKAERNRITQAQKIDLQIEDFISDNLSNYSLKQSVIDEIMTSFHEDDIASEAEIQNMILARKKQELRKLYFIENKDIIEHYAVELPKGLRLSCVNGGFEASPATAGYHFGTGIGDINGCQTPARPIDPSITPAENDFFANVSIISDTLPNFFEFDPFLDTPLYDTIKVKTISPNGGNNCIKLNGNRKNGHGHDMSVTTMYRDLTIGPADDFLEYEFSLFLQDSNHSNDKRPTFRIDLMVNNVVVNTTCYTAEPNCLYKTAHPNNLLPNITGNDVYYTDWRCDRINVSNFRGLNATLIFTITDCEYSNGHYGTVYIDNICNFICEAPAQGSLMIKPLENCESLSSPNYQVCGSFIPPVNSTLNSLTLSCSLNGGAFNIVTGATLNVTGNNYCFEIPSSFFGSNPNGANYQFQLDANYIETCESGSFAMTNSTFAGVTFINCCQPTLTSATIINLEVHEQRSNWIKTTDEIRFNNNIQGDAVVYHAGNFVELNPGFEAVNGSQFVAYPKDCDGNFVYKNGDNQSSQTIALNDSSKFGNQLRIYPNPTSGLVTITQADKIIKSVHVNSIDGKSRLFQNFQNATEFKIDMTNFAAGIYIISAETQDGQIINTKLVKN
ncbi:T9SS type A sorting domain-containing protein [Flavobacterium sp. SM15]|uniref:T9SS type A sorting domain-containing protein n=1 Tax=Flavobacterium sp. SM15 TaxID=2908005 RepID=UPI001EDA4AFC|nr:T9SS type A sorting domain-containing protein [Flavobacterium sp. SM15]MCG2611307.1 T9SS type A sorting domain-containing protein [Flavobacterium sp. SM15]